MTLSIWVSDTFKTHHSDNKDGKVSIDEWIKNYNNVFQGVDRDDRMHHTSTPKSYAWKAESPSLAIYQRHLLSQQDDENIKNIHYFTY